MQPADGRRASAPAELGRAAGVTPLEPLAPKASARRVEQYGVGVSRHRALACG